MAVKKEIQGFFFKLCFNLHCGLAYFRFYVFSLFFMF